MLLTYNHNSLTIKYHSANWKNNFFFWSEFYDFLLHMLNTYDGKFNVFVVIPDLNVYNQIDYFTLLFAENIDDKEKLIRYGKEVYIKTVISNITHFNASSKIYEECETSAIYIHYFPFDLEIINFPEKFGELIFRFKPYSQE